MWVCVGVEVCGGGRGRGEEGGVVCGGCGRVGVGVWCVWVCGVCGCVRCCVLCGCVGCSGVWCIGVVHD